MADRARKSQSKEPNATSYRGKSVWNDAMARSCATLRQEYSSNNLLRLRLWLRLQFSHTAQCRDR